MIAHKKAYKMEIIWWIILFFCIISIFIIYVSKNTKNFQEHGEKNLYSIKRTIDIHIHDFCILIKEQLQKN